MIVRFKAVAIIQDVEMPVTLELNIGYAMRMNGKLEGKVITEHGDELGRFFEEGSEKESEDRG
jgi:hypothetical protein